MSLLTELGPFVAGDATNMPALTGLENPCFICVSSVAKNSNSLFVVRLPQTAFGRVFAGARARPGGRFRHAPLPLKIAQPFMAGIPCPPSSKVPPGTAGFFLSSLAGLFHVFDAIPSHEWLGYCRTIPSAVRRGIFVEPKPK